jgi:hypothetical protein
MVENSGRGKWVTSTGRRRTARKQGKVIAGWLLNSTPSPTQYFNAPAFKTNNKTGKFAAFDALIALGSCVARKKLLA